nr:MAG TPA: hypothetical protein [Caudoviricetes sp.]
MSFLQQQIFQLLHSVFHLLMCSKHFCGYCLCFCVIAYSV